jgi:DNA-binding transcriptional ArsR family regulator
MYNDLSNLPEKEILFEILGIDEKDFDIIVALTLGKKDEYKLVYLSKQLDEFGLYMTNNPLLEHLQHLEEKNIVTSRREGKYRFIKLKHESLTNLLFNEFILDFLKKYENAVEEAPDLELDEIFSIMEHYSINKGFSNLYFRILFLLNPLPEKEKLLLAYIDILNDTTLDIYIDELKRRGTKDTIYILSKMGKIMNQKKRII